MSWWEHSQVNFDENEIYNEHDYVFNGESIFETDTVFSSREELLDWVRKTGYSVGYVVVIKTSKSNESVTLQCDRSGISVSKKKSTKNTGSKKCGCPFELVGKYLSSYNGWMLVVICEAHNHEPALYLEGHSYARRYPLPLLEIVGVTPTNMTFCVAFVFMHKEKTHNYEWALRCLKSLMDGCMFPRVIVTDRELALINAYNSIFPDAKGLLCTWHLNRSVLTKCKGLIKSNKGWFNFNQMWNALIYSETEEAYAHNLEQLTETTVDSPGVIAYLNKHWLARHKELFVVAWTKEYLHFGNHTTSRVESQHAKLKLYLDSSQSNLERVVSYIHEVVNSQVTGVKASIQESRMVMRHRYNIPHFQNLNRFVSLYALDIIFPEFQKCGDVKIYENCRCQLRTSYGLPCSHEQAMYLYAGQPLPLYVIDAFWKKLDFSPCISSMCSISDNLDCEAELKDLNAEFNKQFGLPSTTSVRDPIAKKTTRGRPSGRKTHVPPKPSNSSLPKQARHEYINQFPRIVNALLIGYKMSKLMEIVDFERQLSGLAFMKMNGPPSDIVYCKS
ncbi:FAR-RED impaired response 1-like protein [Tanacetum coccineum]